MSVRVRRALSADAAAIVAIAEESLGEPFDQDRICQLLESGRDCSLVALDARGILAFADNFMTESETGSQRLELDLLAVDAKARGMGIGRLLITESLLLARELDLPLLRALVRSDNLVMRRLCASCGLAASEQGYDLYVASPEPVPTASLRCAGTHLVPVETFAYRGIWIEGGLTPAGIMWALSVGSARQLQRVGALVEQSNRIAIQLLADNGFHRIGAYNYWQLKLKNG